MLAAAASRLMTEAGAAESWILLPDRRGRLQPRQSAPAGLKPWRAAEDAVVSLGAAELAGMLVRSAPHPERTLALPLLVSGELVGAAVLVFAAAPPKRVSADLADVAGAAAMMVQAHLTCRNAQMRIELLERYRDLFMNVAERSGDALLAVDLDGRVLVWNNTCERLFGWSRKEVLGKELPSISVEQHLQVIEALRAAASAGMSAAVNVPIRHKNGSSLVMHSSALLIPDVDGDPTGVVLVTNVLRTDEPLAAARGDLVGALAERMKTPLTALMGYLQLLERPDMPEERARRRRVTHSMLEQARALSSMVEDLAVLAQTGPNDVTLELDEVDLAELVSGLVETLERKTPGGFRIESKTRSRTVIADRRRVEQALRHMLCAGAAKATGDGVVVSLGGGTSNGSVSVSVPGCTLTPEEECTLFEQPFPLGTLRGEEGYGALFIARSIAEAHGGSFSGGEKAGGLTLSMDLPARPGASA
jgi:PAS domain S-box-containing protein